MTTSTDDVIEGNMETDGEYNQKISINSNGNLFAKSNLRGRTASQLDETMRWDGLLESEFISCGSTTCHIPLLLSLPV